ncbi:MAG: SAM-dependent chlorinase/fluorinase [Bacteroidales bacterium]|nr:SAM-dependent chlorinase/fluorinase [Bacteroidales bacterium]
MSIVTLLSDWGLSDYYVAAVKGRLYSEWPEVRIIDISHLIPKFNISAAAHVLKQAYPHFPPGSVHCIGVNDIASEKHPHVMVRENGHYFIGADNGIFPLLFDRKPELAWRIALPSDGQAETFPSLNLFPLAAVHLARGGDPEEIGETYDWPGQDFNVRSNVSFIEYDYAPNGMKTGARINGRIIYTDSYGNGVTNIGRTLVEQAAAEFPRFEIRLRSYDAHRGKKPFDKISRTYDGDTADLCALFLDNRLLEISLVRASAAQLANLKVNSSVTIHFKS